MGLLYRDIPPELENKFIPTKLENFKAEKAARGNGHTVLLSTLDIPNPEYPEP